MGCVRRRGKSWNAQVRVAGWQSFTKTFGKKSDAVRWIQELEQSAKVMCVQVPDKPGFAKESKAEAIAGGEEGPSLGPEEGMLRMMGQQEGLEAAAGWLDTNLPKEGGACQCLEIEAHSFPLAFIRLGNVYAYIGRSTRLSLGSSWARKAPISPR